MTERHKTHLPRPIKHKLIYAGLALAYFAAYMGLDKDITNLALIGLYNLAAWVE